MVTDKGYVPVLLTKRGERSALRDLSPGSRGSLTPLFVVEPIPWDFDNDEPAKTVDEHLSARPQELVDSWGIGAAFVDLTFIDDSPMIAGEHPLVWFTSQCAALGLPLVPVVAIGRSDAYRAATAVVVARDGLGACVRLPVPEWPSGSSVDIDALLLDLSLDPEDVDLVLDVGDEVAAAPGMTERAVRTELGTLPYLADWRSLVVASSGMPRTMPGGRGVHVLPRFDWRLYRELVLRAPPARLPTFADYAIAHSDPSLDVNPRFMSMSATLRYTAADDWLVSKGALFRASGGRGQGAAAVPPAAAALAAHPDFLRGHCGGEVWVQDAATGGPTGNAETWRRYATRHHLELVPEHLAILHGP